LEIIVSIKIARLISQIIKEFNKTHETIKLFLSITNISSVIKSIDDDHK